MLITVYAKVHSSLSLVTVSNGSVTVYALHCTRPPDCVMQPTEYSDKRVCAPLDVMGGIIRMIFCKKTLQFCNCIKVYNWSVLPQ